MNKIYVVAVLALTCVFGGGISAHAQDSDAVVVTVPFDFVAGATTLAAGRYTVGRVNPTVNRELSISGYNEGSAFLLPLAFDSGSAKEPTLSFEHVDGKYFLSRIKTLTGVYTIPTPRQMITLGQTNAPSPSASSSSGSH